MDSTDMEILTELEKNGRITVSEISRRIKLSVPATAERIRKLEESGVVDSYTVCLDRNKMGYRLLAVVFVNIENTEDIAGFRETVQVFPEVIECHHVAGEYDYLLKVLVGDTVELEDFLSNRLKAVRGVGRSNSLVVLSTLKEKTGRVF